MWPGGTAAALTETASATDIISIYWDARVSGGEFAYAVATENFS